MSGSAIALTLPMPDVQLVELLRRHQIAPTQQRLDIARQLLRGCRHVSAEQLRKEVIGSGAYAAKATIYNTLNLFAERGLVRELLVEAGLVFYDTNPTPHYHYYHHERGELTDIPGTALDLSSLPPLPARTRLDHIDVIIHLRDVE